MDIRQYQTDLDPFWEGAPFIGDGYDVMAAAQKPARGWRAIADWGADGYELGSWPFVIVFFHKPREGAFQVAYYVEGDVTMYECATVEERNALVDELAFYHWKQQCKAFVKDYEATEQLPEALRGPYRPQVA